MDFYNLNIYTDTNFKIILLNGNPLNPTIITEYQADSTTPLSGTPSNGTIYRFTKNVNTINYPNNINDDLYIFPNPASEELKISIHNHDFELQPIHIKVLDMFGRILVEKNVLNYDNSKVIPINISQIPKGPYILHLSTNNIILNQKFIKR